jgi:putative Holliday junction resolvase
VGRVLGVDWGRKRHGIALSDGLRLAARGLMALERPRTRREEFDALRGLCGKHDVDQIVVGLPYNMDGTPGTHAEDVARWAHALASDLGLPVDLVDERRTTLQAEHHLRSTGAGGHRKRRQRVDQVAAAIILQSWLDETR